MTAYRCPDVRLVLSDQPYASALVELAATFGAARVMVFASRTLLVTTDMAEQLQRALHGRLAGIHAGAGGDITDEQVLAQARLLTDGQADLVLSIGGGALVDSVKMALIAYAHGAQDAPALHTLRATRDAQGRPASSLRIPVTLKHAVVPTTLTCAEFSDLTGSSPAAGEPKAYYLAPGTAATAVIHDPLLTQHTPMAVWLASGLRALDHAIEGHCSVRPHPLVDAASLSALRYLKAGLLGSVRDPRDRMARSLCQTGAWLAGTAVGRVPFGASHGLGHLLAGLGGVPHGLTSALLLPAVLEHNHSVNAARQAECAAALGADDDADAADTVRRLVHQLGLAPSVAALRVPDHVQRSIAEQALSHFVVASNPRPLVSAGEVLALLQKAGLSS